MPELFILMSPLSKLEELVRDCAIKITMTSRFKPLFTLLYEENSNSDLLPVDAVLLDMDISIVVH
jgi:hypothetical protein